MALDDFLKKAQADFAKKYKDSESEVVPASQEKPPTGLIVDNPLLEFILDRRFVAYGRAYLFYAKKGASKTSLLFDFIKMFQKADGYAFLHESEHALDLDYAVKQGVDKSRLFISHPESLEQAFTRIKSQFKNLEELEGKPVLIALDSIAGCCPEYEQQEGLTIGETKVGEHAKICSAFYRQVEELLAYENAIFVALNQQKIKIGAFAPGGMEPPEALIGGDAQLFHSTYQFKLARTKDLTQKDEHGAERKVGSRHLVTCRRNKLGREGNSQQVDFDLYINGGLDWYSPLVRKLAEEYKGLVTASKGYFKWLTPGSKFSMKLADGETQEGEISLEKGFRDYELGLLIKNSNDAKEAIRKAFGIPDLPPQPVQQEIDSYRQAKRKERRSKKETADTL